MSAATFHLFSKVYKKCFSYLSSLLFCHSINIVFLCPLEEWLSYVLKRVPKVMLSSNYLHMKRMQQNMSWFNFPSSFYSAMLRLAIDFIIIYRYIEKFPSKMNIFLFDSFWNTLLVLRQLRKAWKVLICYPRNIGKCSFPLLWHEKWRRWSVGSENDWTMCSNKSQLTFLPIWNW